MADAAMPTTARKPTATPRGHRTTFLTIEVLPSNDHMVKRFVENRLTTRTTLFVLEGRAGGIVRRVERGVEIDVWAALFGVSERTGPG